MMNTLMLFAHSCSGGSFFGFPAWYAYLPGQTMGNKCVPTFTNINDTWLVLAAVIEMLLRIAGILAVFMVIAGGITYSTSQGNPETTAKAKNTIIYALIGLLISVTAAFLVTFVAGSFGVSQ